MQNLSSVIKAVLVFTSLLFVNNQVAFGQAEIQNPAFPFWKIKGNSSIDTSLHFVGTTDANYLSFRTNSIRRMTIDTGGRVGIGTTVPSLSGMLEVTNINNGNPTYISTNYGNPNEFWFRRSGGVIGAPTLIGSAGSLGRIDARGYDGSVYVNATRIEMLVDSTSGSSNMAGRIIFATNPANSTSTPVERMRINKNGLVGINGTPVSYLDVNGDLALREGALTLANGANNNVVTANNPFPAGKSFYRITGPTAAFNITGLTGGQDGRIIVLYNATAFNMTLTHNSTSTLSNRIYCGNSTDLTVNGFGSITLVYNASDNRWIAAASNATNTGPTGVAGATGTNGTTGANGVNGTTGATGANGSTGATGTTGTNGTTGATGANGTTGATGANGSTGATGVAGATGTNGTTGATGATGANGSTGSTGTAGTTGSAGTNGTTGATGANGTTGATGANGSTGATGTGATGSTGATGITGATGTSTAWGLTGNTGTTDGTNFLGTIDNIPFTIRVNNQTAARIDHLLANAFFGYQTGAANTTGIFNSAIGNQSLFSNTTGSYNTGSGTNTLYFNTSGGANTAVGYQALYSNVSGNSNVATGVKALYSSTTISNTVAVGDSALYKNSSGTFNTAMGSKALFANTSGSSNTTVGYQSISTNTTGSRNSVLGDRALWVNTTGNDNSAMGYLALVNNTTGNNNSAFGSSAMTSNSTGSFNSAFGQQSLPASSGNSNTAVGFKAGFTNGAGTRNSFLGDSANVVSVALTNATAIGWNARVDASNSIVLGSVNGVNGALATVNVGIGINTPTSTLHANGSLAVGVRSVTASTTLTTDDHCLIFTGSTAAQTITIPAAASSVGRLYTIVNHSTVTLNISSVTVGSATTITSIAVDTPIQIISDGTVWRKIN